MLFLICFFVLLTAYVGNGARYARGRYANILAEAQQQAADLKIVSAAKAKMKELDSAFFEMRSTNYNTLSKHHTLGCDKAVYTHIGNCNCGAIKNNRKKYGELNSMIEGSVDEPEIMKPLLLWPAYMIGDFVRTGKPADKELARRMKEIAEAEHNAKIAELRAREAAALDRELESLR